MSSLKERLAGVSEIISLPEILLKVNKLINNPETSATDIAEILSEDIALSTRILKLVNSPLYGFSRQITSINYAIVILGFKTIRNLAMAAFVLDIRYKNTSSFAAKSFWRFSINVGQVTEYLYCRTKLPNKDDAFISGLLHDIGVVILNQHFPEEFDIVLNYAAAEHCTLYQAEKKLLDFDHIEIGRLLLESWNFPESIIRVCQYYSTPESFPQDTTPAAVHLADCFCRALKLGNPADDSITQISGYALERMGIKSSDYYEVFKDILDISLQSDNQLDF